MTVPIRCVVVVEVCGGESAQEVRNGFAKARAHLGRKKIVVVHAHIPSSQSVHRALTELPHELLRPETILPTSQALVQLIATMPEPPPIKSAFR